MPGGTADQVDRSIVFSSIMCICGEDCGDVAHPGEVDQLDTVCETGQAPWPTVPVEPYIVV